MYIYGLAKNRKESLERYARKICFRFPRPGSVTPSSRSGNRIFRSLRSRCSGIRDFAGRRELSMGLDQREPEAAPIRVSDAGVERKTRDPHMKDNRWKFLLGRGNIRCPGLIYHRRTRPFCSPMKGVRLAGAQSVPRDKAANYTNYEGCPRVASMDFNRQNNHVHRRNQSPSNFVERGY